MSGGEEIRQSSIAECEGIIIYRYRGGGWADQASILGKEIELGWLQPMERERNEQSENLNGA